MFKYEEIGEELKAQTQVKTTNYGYITAAKITSPALYELLKLYYSNAKHSCDYNYYPYIDGIYEGEDWYFLEGEPANLLGPSTYRLESLTYKKNQFAKFCAQFD